MTKNKSVRVRIAHTGFIVFERFTESVKPALLKKLLLEANQFSGEPQIYVLHR